MTNMFTAPVTMDRADHVYSLNIPDAVLQRCVTC